MHLHQPSGSTLVSRRVRARSMAAWMWQCKTWSRSYAVVKADKLPIGSVVIEAACKTLVQQRLKRSGMRWDQEGGHAMLNFRSLLRSDRFDSAWQLLAGTYRKDVELPKNVVKFRRK